MYTDRATFMRALGIPSKNEVHVLLVDRQGSTTVWRTTASFDEAKGRALAGAFAAYRRLDACNGQPADTI